MFNHLCVHCGVSFEATSSQRKFCSHRCYQLGKVGKKQSEQTVERRRQTMLGQQYTPERCANIGKARWVKLDETTETELVRLLKFGMPDGYVRASLGLGVKVYNRYKRLLFPDGIPWQIKWLESDVSEDTVCQVVEQANQRYGYRTIARNLGMCDKTVKLILTALHRRDPTIECLSYNQNGERFETKPEKCIRETLDKLGVPFKQEQRIGKAVYVYDFHLTGTNLLIEVQGDYWHCNPAVYPKPINDLQIKAQKRDKRKRSYASHMGFKTLWIWEKDIETSLSAVEERLKHEYSLWKQANTILSNTDNTQ